MLSARNQLRGTVKTIVLGEVMAEVAIELSTGETITSVITRGSAENLDLRPEDEVTAIIKATEVLVEK
ncbi:MAG: TOBE domain-containing protein [Actinobacteria bacterium]|nr:TOBE domain-containing protein [Actinomycetota bacterium]